MAPEDPTLLGLVEQQEQSAIVALHRQHQALVFQLGNLDLKKFETVAQIDSTNEQIQGLYSQIGKRLNIPPKTRWTVTPDGKVREVPTPRPQEVKQEG